MIEKKNQFMDRYFTTTMKGIGIFCVMLCHFMGTFGKGITLFTPLGGIGVSLFLIMSGYGLSESWKVRGGQEMVEKTFGSCHNPVHICGTNRLLVVL